MTSLKQVQVVTPAASSQAITGNVNQPGTPGAIQYSAAFTPQLGRDMYLTLVASVGFDGEVQIERSTNAGGNWYPVTISGGQVWGNYTGSCDEVVDTPTDAAGIYRLKFDITAGSVSYRLAQ